MKQRLEQLLLFCPRAALEAPDLFEHNLFGLNNSLFLYCGVKQDVRQDTQELIEMVAVPDDEIPRIVVPCETVDVPTQILDLPLDGTLHPSFSPGENKVFQKMGKPAFRRTFARVAGTDKNESGN